ncbi:PucR family transcriptional regulator [Mumia zhuanghuii]|uniref:PucR family transcriptional regulator n=2 Tax=Mumia TaxID=1546255 RepID=UPI00363AF0F9
MTSNKGETADPLRIAGEPIASRLRIGAPELARNVVAQMLAEIPAYSDLPFEELTHDIVDIVERCLRMTADVVERRCPASSGEFEPLRESAAHRADEGVPLDSILSAYQLGLAMCWERISTDASPDDLADMREALGHILDVHRKMVVAVTSAYMEARRLVDGEEREGRHAAMSALLAGEADASTGLTPAPEYVAMVLAIAPHPDEQAPGASAGIAARRKLRRVRELLDRVGAEQALVRLDSTGGTVLFPTEGPADWDDLRKVVAGAAESAGVDVTAAASVVKPSQIPSAVAQDREIIDLVRRTGRPPGLYQLADVLLDYQLSRATAALPGLAMLLEPLEARPELLNTLELYLQLGLDRRATASALHVHPNTVDYRIRRIDTLTGLSPIRHQDLPGLRAALIARAHRADGASG